MELREHTAEILRRHGVARLSGTALCLAELVEVYWMDSEDRLLSGLMQDAADRRGIKLHSLHGMLRNLARRMGREDPAWYRGVFPRGYSTWIFVRAVAQEAMEACRTAAER